MAENASLLVVENLPDTFDSIKPKLALYFQNKRRSGGEVLEIRDHPEDKRKALLLYKDAEAKKKVLAKGVHEVDFKQLGVVKLQVRPFEDAKNEVKPTAQPVRLENSVQLGEAAASRHTKAISEEAVTPAHKGDYLVLLSSSGPVDEEYLRLYFEQYSEDIEITKKEENRWILKCSNKNELEETLHVKEHTVDGSLVSVELYDEKAEEEKCDPRRFILMGFSEDTKLRLISVYIQSCSKGAEHSWEVLDSEGLKIVVTFKQDIDVKSFLQKCSKKKLQNKEIAASRLEHTDSVLVQGQTSNIMEDTLNLYFSNFKRSKGGTITSVTGETGTGGVIVTFQDCLAAQRVAKEQHMLCGVRLTAHLYYRRFQKALTGETCPTPNLPSKTAFPVNPLLLNYINRTKKYKDELETVLRGIDCKVHIHNEGEIQPHEAILEHTCDSDSLSLYRVASSWESDAKQTFHSFLDQFKVHQLIIEKEVWEKIADECLELSNTDLKVSFEASTSMLVLVGEKDRVISVRDKVERCVKKAKEELLEIRNTIERKVIVKNREELNLLWNLVYDKLEDVESSSDDGALALYLKGHRDKVDKAEKVVKEAKSTLITQALNLPTCTAEFLKSLDLEEFKLGHFLQNGIRAAILNHKSLEIVAVQNDAKKAEDKIKELLKDEVISLTHDQTKATKIDEWNRFFSELKEEVDSSSSGCGISITQTDTKITLAGFSSVVADVTRKLKGYLENKRPVTEVIPLKEVHEVDFIDSCMKVSEVPEIKAMDVTILPVRTQASPGLKVSAAADNIKSAVAAVEKQIALIAFEKCLYNKAGESKVLEKHQDTLKARAKEFGCMLWLTIQQDTPTALPVLAAQSYSHKLCDAFYLHIAQGHITKRKADALVCPLNGDLTFDNPIAQEVLDVGGDEIRNDCETIIKDRQATGAGEVILTCKGKLPVKILIVAVTPIWGKCNYTVRGNPMENMYLSLSVHRCLQTAEENQCASIVLPALGCGSFGFPVSESARVVMKAILEYCESKPSSLQNLKDIYVIEPDGRIIQQLNAAVKDMASMLGQTNATGKAAATLPALTATAASPVPVASTVHATLPSFLLKATSAPTVNVSGVTVTLKKGDVTKETVDAIVNSTNNSLNLDSGVSGAILNAAGSSVVDECTKLGSQPSDGVVCTGGGNLNCKHIIQMVGPTTTAGIIVSVEKVLQECDNNKVTSVAFPSIGTGRGGIKPKDSIVSVLKGFENYFSKSASTGLKSIFMVAFEQKVYDSFQDYFAERNLQSSGNTKATNQASAFGPQTVPSVLSFINQGQVHVQSMQSPSQVKIYNVTVTIKKGDITTETVKGIVNSTNTSLNLNSGVSGAIFKAAGSSVQDECKALGSQPADGLVVTSGGSLSCDFILHMVGPKTMPGIESQVEKALQECEKKQITTISFPAIGTGAGGLSPNGVIESMLQGFKNHLSLQRASILKLIYIVVAQDKIFDEFTDGLKQWTLEAQDECPDSDDDSDSKSESEYEDLFPLVNNIEIKMGSIKVQAVCGDITKEKTDAIVNSTTTTLNLTSGVSGAILKAAGQLVVDECTALGVQQSDGFAVTKPGNLQVKHIIHMVGQTTVPAITQSMCKVLKACENMKIQSVSFPALGTGAGNLSASQVATAMVDAVSSYVIDHVKPSLSVVRIVIFQQNMMLDFEKSLEKFKKVTPRAIPQAPVKTVSSRVQAVISNTSPTAKAVKYPVSTVEVYSTSKDGISKVKECIKDLIAEECSSSDIDSEHISHLLDAERQQMAQLCEKQQIQLEIGQRKITVSGKRDDVLTAALTINKLIQNAKERDGRKQEEKRMKKTVRWEMFIHGKPKALGSRINYELEVAYHKKEKTYVYSHNGKSYTVDMGKMQQADQKGNVIKLKRMPLTDSETAIIEQPESWTNMKNKDFEIIVLAPNTKEFLKISKEFVKSCNSSSNKNNVEVVQIERIQHLKQWQSYAVRKQTLDRKYPKATNERILYHGTTKDICQRINKTGFNRSFCGRNATRFGQGTYFAKEASYSCHNSYSNPDENGHKYIYRARVITGKLCQGIENLKEPTPVNPNDPNSDLCDCAVDSEKTPFIFVIFCDDGAYPEYLITFKILN
ncbi:protein mono-ADP-ribosyltransferase PARP14-like [Acipenser ruthenus]|uniref:protein mono-ADP-ribosyltransferase PARP14-like n=1 Tax=Acipenser ruthenus TaxID=7906 RepID=UPI0027404851|nr:protein mono-ADP-ribosyltransferase PARP14-like [Acipenser ruthenus]